MIPRIALVAGGLAAMALAFPKAGALSVILLVTGLAALVLSALRPWSAAPAALMAAAVGLFLLTSGSAGLPRIAALATALAVVHFSAALAAVVPVNATVERALLWWWVLRCGVVSAGGLLLVLATAALPTTPAPLASAVGAIAVLPAAAVAGWWRSRRPSGPVEEAGPASDA